MNVLLFITSMIMVMAALTYARIETYRSFSLLQGEFKHYMDKTERGYINLAAEDWYSDTSAAKAKGDDQKKSNTKGTKKGTKNGKGGGTQAPTTTLTHGQRALYRLSFASFINQKTKEKHAKEFPTLHLLAKKLIYLLYKDQPFFQQMLQKRADFVDLLLSSLMAADALPKKLKLKKAEDLAHLDLGDEELNAVLYKMLQKTIDPPEKKPSQVSALTEEDKGEDDEDKKEKNEYHTPTGFFSLLDFITLEDSTKIRVYLASKKILQAIFDNPADVNSIIETRNLLYNNVRNKKMTADKASELFKSQFDQRKDPNFDETILDFTVTSTNPKKYE